MRRARDLFRALALGLVMATPALPQSQPLRFADLSGWAQDDHAEALTAFRETCSALKAPAWAAVCDEAASVGPTPAAARAFFEDRFRPVLIGQPPALFTAYYEPELDGSPVRTPRFAHPVYRRPPEFDGKGQWHSRAEIERRGLLRGRGLELAWLADPVEVFFLHVQGSGRIRMTDGQTIRLGFAAKNNHPYRSIGAEMVRRGLIERHKASAGRIKAWARQNPHHVDGILQHNPSFVFFRKLADLPPHRGPIGAMGRSVTAMRSIAVDPDHVPLGAPVWIEKEGAAPMHRLMVAQDTGTAIKGAQRADIFFGTGAAAGRAAGRVRDGGRLVTLLPRAMITGN